MPKTILLYAIDYNEDGTPIFAVATGLDDLPEDSHGEEVGQYELVSKGKLEVSRTLKSCK